MTDMLLGIDVSHHQSGIDWGRVAASGIAFCFCRATYGIRGDHEFVHHFRNARAAGLVTGAYHFLRFHDRMSAEAQAQAFLESLAEAGAATGPMLAPALDLEDNGRYDEVVDTNAERQAYAGLAMKWLEIVEADLGRTAIIYTTRSFFNQIGNPPGFGIRPLWVAHYTSRPSPGLPAPWSRYLFWQFTEGGQVPGISGAVDKNRFDGDTAALHRLTEVTDEVTPSGPVTIDEGNVESAVSSPGVQGAIQHVVPKGLNIRSEPKIADYTLITSLPLAHPVEVIEPGIEGAWSRVRALFRGQEIEGYVAERYLRDPLPPSKESLIAAAVRQWLRFHRGAGKETQSPYCSYVREMWQALGMDHDGRDTSVYWSAAFISFIVRNAGAAYDGFKFSARHSKYVHDAIVKKERNQAAPFWGHRLDEYAPRLGDLIAQWRHNSRTYDEAKTQDNFPSHVDVVVRLTDSYAETIGGNVSNSVSMKEEVFPLDDNGFLKPVARAFAVLENRTG